MDERMTALKSVYLAEYAGTLTRGEFGEEITFRNTFGVRWSPEANTWVKAHSWEAVDCIGVWDATFGIIPNLGYSRYSEVIRAALAVYHKEQNSFGRLKQAARALD